MKFLGLAICLGTVVSAAAVYFGWLGTGAGLIAITGTPSFVWGDVEKMGPALAVSMLTLLYGYSLKLVTIALTEDWFLFFINLPIGNECSETSTQHACLML